MLARADQLAPDVNRPASLATLVLHSSFAAFVLLTAPALVGAFITELELTPRQAGYVISADMAGMGLASVPAMFWLTRINWHKVALVSLWLNALCHFLSAGADSFAPLLWARLFAGLFAGTSMCVCLASIGLTEHKERNFAFWVVGQLVLASLGLALMPRAIPQWGLGGVYIALALGVLLISTLVKFLPSAKPEQARVPDRKSDTGTPAGCDRRRWLTGFLSNVFLSSTFLSSVLGILAIYCFYVALGGVWTYLERIGDASGISAERIGYYLSIASLTGIAGALSASCLGDKWGCVKPVILGFCAILAALLLLLGTAQAAGYAATGYVIAASLFKYAWTFVLPFMLAALSATDASGRVIVTINIFIGAGLTTGPALASSVLKGESYTPVIYFGLIVMGFSFVFIMWSLSRIAHAKALDFKPSRALASASDSSRPASMSARPTTTARMNARSSSADS